MIPDEDTERGLLAAIRDAPDDPAPREVYADWLEQRGQFARAAFLRRPAAPGDADGLSAEVPEARWRALVTRTPVARCGAAVGFQCAQRWEDLAWTDDALVRRCDACARPVYFCTSLLEIMQRGWSQESIACDVAVAHLQAEWHAGHKTGPYSTAGGITGKPADVAPRSRARRVLDGIRGWFARR